MLKRIRGSIMLLITAIIWGTAFVAQSEGMNYVEPFTYNLVRTFLGGIVLIPIILILKKILPKGKRTPESKTSAKATVTGGICCGFLLFAASSFQQFGISYTTAGKAGFITALYVVIVPVIGIFFGRRTSLKTWICAGIAVFGFYLLCIKSGFAVLKGDLLVLICAIFFAMHIIAIDHFNSKNSDGMVMSCVQFFTAGILMIPCMFIFESPSWGGIFAARNTILYAGIMSSGIAYTLQIVGQRYTAPTVATLILSLESVFAALSGWLFLSEKLSVKEFTGCVVVFSAVILAQIDIKSKSYLSNGDETNEKEVSK
ncbi:MAG: DMT family transporter [Ruminococcus sp.]|uniref:DMT family transporter n=1 Tax=Ruminococcus sp. TaxID=41978 RepID=UPI0025E81E64|nr:DMT family transporter [Ruminococcus sp.]MCR5601715.1 DMT family transporter [Ruminococcus sp.]